MNSEPRTVPLVRYLSKCRVATRVEARTLVLARRVAVNGRVCVDGARRVDPRRDQVVLDGEAVRPPGPDAVVWLAMNKPRGVLVTTRDPEGRRTVMDLLSAEARSVAGLVPVGRLDQASAGLLLFTNDTTGAARLLDPRTHVPKTYRVKVRGHVAPTTLEGWRRETLVVDGLSLGPMEVAVEREGPASTWLRVVLHEGRNRQIRRRMEAAGHEVEHLIRVAIGPLDLGTLEPGATRRLRPPDVRRLSAAGAARE